MNPIDYHVATISSKEATINSHQYGKLTLTFCQTEVWPLFTLVCNFITQELTGVIWIWFIWLWPLKMPSLTKSYFEFLLISKFLMRKALSNVNSLKAVQSVSAQKNFFYYPTWQYLARSNTRPNMPNMAKYAFLAHIWARQIWSSGVSLKRSCKMLFRRVGLRSIGPSSQKLWPNQLF